MASLDSYIKDRNDRVEKGTLVYDTQVTGNPRKVDFNKLNCNTFRHNNGAWSDKTRLYY